MSHAPKLSRPLSGPLVYGLGVGLEGLDLGEVVSEAIVTVESGLVLALLGPPSFVTLSPSPILPNNSVILGYWCVQENFDGNGTAVVDSSTYKIMRSLAADGVGRADVKVEQDTAHRFVHVEAVGSVAPLFVRFYISYLEL